MRGGAVAASWLKAQGVSHVFTLCGEHTLPLLDACLEAGIRVIGSRHEQAAVLEAEAYARATGRPGVAVVTAGPGVANAVTGLAVASSSGSPVLLLAGRTSHARRLTGTFQDVDGRAIVAGVAKWSESVPSASRIPAFLSTAWRRMLGGRPGGVMVELAHDVLTEETDAEVARVPIPIGAGAAPEALSAALAALSDAERPVAIVGSGAFWSGAGEALRAFAERTRIPVTTLNAARGLLPDGHESCLGPLSEAGLALLQADVVLLVGTKLDASVTFGGPPLFTGNERLVQIDIEPAWVGLNRAPDVAVLGDARSVLTQLTDAWDAKSKDAWCAQAKETAVQMHGAWEGMTSGDGSPVPPGRVVREVIRQAGPDATLISDGGDVHTWCVTTMPASRPGSLLTTHDAIGTIGIGVPYAVGAKAADPTRTVVAVVGDGAFGFNAMELETAARNDLPVVIVVANNGGWGNIRYEEGLGYRETSVTELSVAGYEKVAEAVGGHAERVEDAAALGPAIRRAIDSGKPAVVNVITQRGVVSQITEMVVGMQML